MDVLLPFVIITLAGTIALVFASQRVGGSDSAWLVRVVLIAFALRIAAATMFALIPGTRMFHEDAEGYERIGMAIAAGWRHEGPPVNVHTDLNQNYGYFYFTAGIYYLFGACRVAASYVNAVLGALTVVLVYRVGRQFFHPLVARRAALLTAFIPSMILWSSVALKDPVMTFLIVLCLSSSVSLKRRFSAAALAGTVLPIAAMQPIRFYMVYFLIVAILGSLVFERGARALVGVSKQVVLVLAVIGVLAMVGLTSGTQQGVEAFDFERMSTFRKGMATSAESGFANDADISTPGRALAFLPIGASYLLLSPFPWQFTSLRASFAAPEMLVWWWLLPSLVRGIRLTVRERLGECSPILLFTLLLTAVYSLMHGNVGSGFRQRAQIFVFLFIFASLGQLVRRCRRAGIDENRLLAGVPAPVPRTVGTPALVGA